MAKKKKVNNKLDLLTIVGIACGVLALVMFLLPFTGYKGVASLYGFTLGSLEYTCNGFIACFGAEKINGVLTLVGNADTAEIAITATSICAIAFYMLCGAIVVTAFKFLATSKAKKYIGLFASVVFLAAAVMLVVSMPNAFAVAQGAEEDALANYKALAGVYVVAGFALISSVVNFLPMIKK